MTITFIFFSHDQAMEVARMARASSIISVDLNPAKYVQGTIYCYLHKEKRMIFGKC